MNYEIGKMKVDELAGYFKDGKINLIPPFQRGRAWSPALRKKLLENMVRGRPIPAIFLYKDEAGSKYSYNILDGKQRLESILLFIGCKREDLAIPNWKQYFFKTTAKPDFKIDVSKALKPADNRSFADLDDETVRNFREYKIPTIEIDMDREEGGIQELIDLFIDINQLGVKVSRWNIVRTMYSKNRLLADIFKLVAIRQKRRKDWFYKMVDNDFTFVLKRLQSVQSLEENQSEERVDRMWERLLEIALFVRTGQHRTLAQILKAFIGVRVDSAKLSPDERQRLASAFKFLRSLYGRPELKESRLAMDQPHFYTMVTSIIALNLASAYPDLSHRIAALAKVIDGKDQPPRGYAQDLRDYMDLSSKQTTHPGRRQQRQDLFAKLIGSV